MGREIKFRAWDKVAKKFLIPWPEGFYILGEATCFDLIGMQLKERSPEKATLEMLNDVELEQYTGLKDRNGAEIYESDVLENQKGDRFVMEYGGLAFGWRGLTPYANRLVEFSYDTITNPKLTRIPELTIIGDIHQNPELLDG